MSDGDILSIQRQRRQRHHCVRCNTPSGRATLCRVCRAAWAYCPACEAIGARPAALRADYASCVCRTCSTRRSRIARGMHHDRATTDALRAERRHRLMPELLKRYRRHEPIERIAAALGLTRAQLHKVIQTARLRSEWPDGLYRARHGKRGES